MSLRKDVNFVRMKWFDAMKKINMTTEEFENATYCQWALHKGHWYNLEDESEKPTKELIKLLFLFKDYEDSF